MLDPLIVVLHLPRTAGRSLKKALRRTYGPAFVDIKARAADPLEEVAQAIAPEARIVQGHLNWGLHRRLDRPIRYATLLRDPVQRTLSHFQLVSHMRAAAGREPIELDRFIDSPIAGNLQAEMIAGVFELEPLSETGLFERARQNLAGFWLIGAFDRLQLYAEALGAAKLKASNSRGPHPRLTPEQLARIRSRTAVDRELYEQVRRRPVNDVALWQERGRDAGMTPIRLGAASSERAPPP